MRIFRSLNYILTMGTNGALLSSLFLVGVASVLKIALTRVLKEIRNYL
jgi:hypothetical protein